MRIILGVIAVAAIGLTGCKKSAPANNEPPTKIEMASAGAGGCHGAKGTMASASEGEVKKQCAKKDASMASGHCKTKGASAQLASANAGDCNDCPKTADGKCDHEAGAKLGKECCKKALASAATH